MGENCKLRIYMPWYNALIIKGLYETGDAYLQLMGEVPINQTVM